MNRVATQPLSGQQSTVDGQSEAYGAAENVGSVSAPGFCGLIQYSLLWKVLYIILFLLTDVKLKWVMSCGLPEWSRDQEIAPTRGMKTALHTPKFHV